MQDALARGLVEVPVKGVDCDASAGQGVGRFRTRGTGAREDEGGVALYASKNALDGVKLVALWDVNPMLFDMADRELVLLNLDERG